MSGRSGAGARGPRSLSHHIALFALLLLAPMMALGVATSMELAGRLRGVAEQSLKAGANAVGLAVTHEVEARLLLHALAMVRDGTESEAAASPGDAATAAARAEGRAGAVPASLSRAAEDAWILAASPLGDAPLRANMAAAVPAARLAEAMAVPNLPDGAFAMLLDPEGRVVARTAAALAIETAPGWLREAVAAGREGPLRGRAPQQGWVVLFPEPLRFAGWTVLVGQAEDRFTGSWRTPALRRLAGGLIVAAIGLFFAGWFATRLQRALPNVASPDAARASWPRVAEFEALARAVRDGHAALRAEAAHAAQVAAENRRLAEDAANDRQLLVSIMESAPEPIFVKDINLRYVLVNEVSASTVGMRASDVLGNRDADFVDKAQAAIFNTQDRTVIESGATIEHERVLVVPNTGERRRLRTVKAPWRSASGEIIGVVGIARDITRHVEAEQRLRAAEEALRKIARADTLTVMSLGVAHELNQPLTAVSNFLRASLRWLDQGTEDPARVAAARAAIAEAAAETLRAAEILRRLRDFIGRGETEQAIMPLAPLLVETASLIRAARVKDDIAIALDLSEKQCGVLGDRVQLQQVFVNLLRNAVEATEGLADRGLAVTLATGNREATIIFADRGPGLPPEVTERLFEPFVSTREEGMGVGLSISRTIVEAHGGRIAARPREGGGTEFVIVLPLREG
ncbi:MAG: PAS domain-containing protein [Rubritepida sp.]|nr:PAS domain-containing protein [Rubritepida sp.]